MSMSSAAPPEHRPAKRIRQACEPCRRKKSRCPGERPNCSHCTRLGQTCIYANDHPANDHPYAGSNADTTVSRGRIGSVEDADAGIGNGPCADRLTALESKVAEVLGALNRIPWNGTPPTPSPSSNITSHPPIDQSSQTRASTLPPWETVILHAELYLKYCNCQPLPLFSPKDFISTLGMRDPEILFGILALAVRFSDDVFRDSQYGAIKEYAEAARSLVMRRISNGPIELSTLQTLCLLGLVDFSNGNTHRASTCSSLALDLANCAGLSTECHISLQDSAHEERRRCFWSILLLKRLQGSSFGIYSFSAEEKIPWYPTSAERPRTPETLNAMAAPLGPSPQDGPKDLGIIAYCIQLSEYWHKTVRYARRRANSGTHPPWSSESEYSKIVVQMMEFEAHMPYRHRFRPAKLSERTTEELEKQRDYWAPWLFSQIIYHTILCILNHPLILSLRLQNFRVVIPEIFLQHTADLIVSHTDWVVHFIDLLEEKVFRVSDPFLGQCVAIVATIYLQQSFADDVGIRNEKRNNFIKCLDFVRKLGEQWHHVAQIASKLQQFESTVSASYRDSAASPASASAQPSVFIDLTSFWEILESVFTAETADSAGSLFGSSLSHHSTATAPRGEVVSSRLLPEPTYPRPDGSRNSIAMDHAADAAMLGGRDLMDSMNLTAENDELAVLAQSFFAQGQDFVRGVDDWWTFG